MPGVKSAKKATSSKPKRAASRSRSPKRAGTRVMRVNARKFNLKTRTFIVGPEMHRIVALACVGTQPFFDLYDELAEDGNKKELKKLAALLQRKFLEVSSVKNIPEEAKTIPSLCRALHKLASDTEHSFTLGVSSKHFEEPPKFNIMPEDTYTPNGGSKGLFRVGKDLYKELSVALVTPKILMSVYKRYEDDQTGNLTPIRQLAGVLQLMIKRDNLKLPEKPCSLPTHIKDYKEKRRTVALQKISAAKKIVNKAKELLKKKKKKSSA